MGGYPGDDVTSTIAVEGTWERKSEIGWADRRSRWVSEARGQGVRFADPADPFEWSTALDGMGSQHTIWSSWGTALVWYAYLKVPNEPVNLVAHSHGGQVAAYALAQGLKVKTLVTVAAPVRWDMRKVWLKARRNLEKWHHIHTGYRDWWQVLGAVRDGEFGIRREMPSPALNICIPGQDHSELMDPELWVQERWFDFLK